MSRSQNRLSLKRAFGLSMVLHLMLAPLFVTTAMLPVGGGDSAGLVGAETTRVSYLRIERRARAPLHPIAVSRPVRSTPRPARAAVIPRLARAGTSVPTRKRPDSSRMPRAGAPGALGRIALALATAAPERASQSAEERESPEPAPVTTHAAYVAPAQAPTPVATPPAQVAGAVAHGMDVPPGGWGQSFDKPLVADEAALAELRSHYHAASTVTVEVDEAGHAVRISLPGGLSDDVRAELEKRLRELRYVPAECNGLRCGGTLQILI